MEIFIFNIPFLFFFLRDKQTNQQKNRAYENRWFKLHVRKGVGRGVNWSDLRSPLESPLCYSIIVTFDEVLSLIRRKQTKSKPHI